MRLLLDTHTFIWFIQDDPALSEAALRMIEDADYQILLSIVSVWELGIKVSLRKINLPAPYDHFIDRQLLENDIQVLPLSIAEIGYLSTLPFHHRDPFDRALVAQSMVNSIPLISADQTLDRYGPTRLW